MQVYWNQYSVYKEIQDVCSNRLKERGFLKSPYNLTELDFCPLVLRVKNTHCNVCFSDSETKSLNLGIC